MLPDGPSTRQPAPAPARATRTRRERRGRPRRSLRSSSGGATSRAGRSRRHRRAAGRRPGPGAGSHLPCHERTWRWRTPWRPQWTQAIMRVGVPLKRTRNQPRCCWTRAGRARLVEDQSAALGDVVLDADGRPVAELAGPDVRRRGRRRGSSGAARRDAGREDQRHREQGQARGSSEDPSSAVVHACLPWFGADRAVRAVVRSRVDARSRPGRWIDVACPATLDPGRRARRTPEVPHAGARWSRLSRPRTHSWRAGTRRPRNGRRAVRRRRPWSRRAPAPSRNRGAYRAATC